MSDVAIDPSAQGAKVLERLYEQLGGAELLEAALMRDDVELVGGAVRDLLLERVPRELDVVVAEDAPGLAQALAERLQGGATVHLHERFGTALVDGGLARIDVATRRAESYPAPGVLPEIRAGTPDEDLLRRDFTINAIAVGLGSGNRGNLRQVPGALEDLRKGRIRVLHDASFMDDPTRLLRMARYWARLHLEVDDRTLVFASDALADGALETVSGARVGAELRLALNEFDRLGTLGVLDAMGVLAALQSELRFDERLAARALELLPADGRQDMLLMAIALLPLIRRIEGPPEAQAAALLNRLEFSSGERDLALATALAAVPLLEALPACETPAELHDLLAAVPLEAVALAGGLGGEGNGRSGAREIARRWLEELCHVRLQITGEDLLAAGVAQGPEIGARLRATLALRLNGELAEGREAELAAALELPWPS